MLFSFLLRHCQLADPAQQPARPMLSEEITQQLHLQIRVRIVCHRLRFLHRYIHAVWLRVKEGKKDKNCHCHSSVMLLGIER